MRVQDDYEETKRKQSGTIINIGTPTKIQTFKLFSISKDNTDCFTEDERMKGFRKTL